MMVMTILEAQVPTGQWDALRRAYREATQHLDEGIAQTFLLQGRAEPTTWRIVTVWESSEALDAMRKSVQTPRGILIFREAGAEPVHSAASIFDVDAHVVD